jgi:hypothetical protein
MKPRYGVVVHRTPTDEVLLSENRERSMAKGFRIEDIAWLKKRDSLGYGSTAQRQQSGRYGTAHSLDRDMWAVLNHTRTKGKVLPLS